MKMKSGLVRFFMVLMAVFLLCSNTPTPDAFCGDPPWRAEFDETCANTSDAMALTPAELETLIAKCERLQKAIEQLDESTRKVFLKRLMMCKNLYQFVLDAKKNSPENVAK